MPDYETDQRIEGAVQSALSLNVDPAIAKRTINIGHLDKVLVRGVGWTATVKWLTQGITWGTTIIVARLLAPSDYGLIGMASVYIVLFTLVSEFGIGTAVVTLRDLTENQVSQLNTLSVLLGVVGCLISAVLAIPLGKFFRAPALPLIVVVLGTGFIASGIRTVPYSLLQKDLRFKLLAFIDGLQGIVQALLTLILAFLGFGYWALALGILSSSVTPTILTLFWRQSGFAFPKLSCIRNAVHYSRRILIARLAWAGYNNSDFIVAGRVLGETPLGAYTLAWTLAHTPLEKLTTLINRVTPAVFATIQKDRFALRRYVRNITGVLALAIFPATIGIALVSPEFVRAILGLKWQGAILPLEILAIYALIRSNIILLTPLLNVIGEESLVMWNSLLALFVLPISFYVGSHWGTTGIAAGWVVVYPLLQIPLLSRTFRQIDLRVFDYVAAIWPAVSACMAMVVSVEAWKLTFGVTWPAYERLISEVLIGVVTYGLVLTTLHRSYLKRVVRFIVEVRLARASTASVS